MSFFIKETTRQFLSALKRSFGLFCLEDVAHSLFSERRVDILLMCVHLFSDTITQTLQSTKISKRLSKLLRFLLQRIVEFRRKCKIAAALLFRTIFPFFFFFLLCFLSLLCDVVNDLEKSTRRKNQGCQSLRRRRKFIKSFFPYEHVSIVDALHAVIGLDDIHCFYNYCWMFHRVNSRSRYTLTEDR